MKRSIWLGMVVAFGLGLVTMAQTPNATKPNDTKSPPSAQSPAAHAPNFAQLAAEYKQTTQPLLARFCLDCHSTAAPEGELDLERFASLEDARRDAKPWLRVAEMLDNGEMPPKDAEQPSADQRKQLRSWVQRYLDAEALAQAGDPGPVVLRRLSNAEYTYTIRDLTGVPLDPAREFPADSAAGEGFTNTGNALVMSPAMLSKYLDAGKDIAAHAVLLPEGFRFSTSTTRRDWTDECLNQIRAFYGHFTESGGAETVTQQGIELDKNKGGALPLKRYLLASLECRQQPERAAEVAQKHHLSPKYLTLLVQALRAETQSPLMDELRARWRMAKPEDIDGLIAQINQWQNTLWKFSSVGHIGKVNGPKAWMEPVTPLVGQQDLRLKLTPAADAKEIVLYLVAGDAGDGAQGDLALWQRPQLVLPGRAPILLRDLKRVVNQLTAGRERLLASTAKCLAAAAEASAAREEIALAELARRHAVDTDVLSAWFDYLGIAATAEVKLNHLAHPIAQTAGYDFVQGWGSPDLPSLVTNATDQPIRIPGSMKPFGVAVHPTPNLNVAVGWRSPVRGAVKIEGGVTDAHPECGNGVTWSLELRRGKTRQVLAQGTTQGGARSGFGPIENLAIAAGDLLSLSIGPRDGEHTCDLTDLELTIATAEERWSLSDDVARNIRAGNPHADSKGREAVWHFYSEPATGAGGPTIPAGSLLARWQAAETANEKGQLAEALQAMLLSGPSDKKGPDAELHRQLTSLAGPLLAGMIGKDTPDGEAINSPWGLDANLFGKRPDGSAIDEASLCVQAPSVIEVRLPIELAAGGELVATGTLDAAGADTGSVQLQITTTRPAAAAGLRPSGTQVGTAPGTWSSNNQRVSYATPVVVADGGQARQRFEHHYDEFRQLFPASLCYTKIVPVDEVVTLTLHHREDDHLARLILDEQQQAQLNRMWDELHFASQDALQLVDAFEQLWQFATQDADPSAFEPLREPIKQRAAAFRKQQAASESKHVDALADFAARAYRRPLTAPESDGLRSLYRSLREQELSHDEAFRFALAKVFVSPAFLYRLEQAPEGNQQAPVSDWELASRLSYFLWSSQPDDALRAAAQSGRLREPEVLEAQARRMLADPRARRLATEFACQWLHIYQFDALDEKSEKLFPEFTQLRGDMYEEAIQFFTHLFQNDGSLVSLLDADHTFVNQSLAAFYGIEGITGPEWQRVEGMKARGRGGILGLSATLAKQSGASRTSPILRGTWICEVLLGEKLPKPPKDVPILPDEDGSSEGLTVRELVARHVSDPKCQGCHQRIDPFGFSLEAFDAIGRRRTTEAGNLPLDLKTTLPDGTGVEDLAGLRDYLLAKRRDVFLRQFCRKLLGYALGRGVQLSDEPLLADMQQQLKANDYRFSVAINTILQSRQFREIRGKDFQDVAANPESDH